MADAREQFERWYVGSLSTVGAREIERDSQGQYVLMQARLAWQAYHAGWLERAPDAPGTPPNAAETPPNAPPNGVDVPGEGKTE